MIGIVMENKIGLLWNEKWNDKSSKKYLIYYWNGYRNENVEFFRELFD